MTMWVQESPAFPSGMDPALRYSLSKWMRETAIIINRRVYPVGSIFVSVDPTDPAQVLGYGTWTAFASGRVIIGVDAVDADFDTVEETGGSKTATL